jgi:hypothetical protein
MRNPSFMHHKTFLSSPFSDLPIEPLMWGPVAVGALHRAIEITGFIDGIAP